MKRLLALLLAMIMVLSLVACTKDDKTIDTPDVTDGNVAVEADTSDTTTSAEEAHAVPISRGAIDGNVYTNDYLGITFTKSDSWVFASDKELSALLNTTADKIYDNEFISDISKLVAVFAMMATDTSTGNNLNITYENLEIQDAADITLEEYLDIAKIVMGNTLDANYEWGEYEYVYLGETEFLRLMVDTEISGTVMQQSMYVRKIDSYMAVITITVVDGSDISDIEARFNKDYVEPEVVLPDIVEAPRGVVSETSYRNEILGFEFSGPDWIFMTSEEYTESTTESVLSTWANYYYLDDAYGTNYELLADFAISAQFVGYEYDEETYLDFYKDLYLEEAVLYELEYEITDYKKVMLGNTEFVKFDYIMIISDEENWTASHYAKIIDGVMFSMQITVFSNIDISEIEAQFVAI